jgi:hypothetical protein
MRDAFTLAVRTVVDTIIMGIVLAILVSIGVGLIGLAVLLWRAVL